jgi:hypothetical protein
MKLFKIFFIGVMLAACSSQQSQSDDPSSLWGESKENYEADDIVLQLTKNTEGNAITELSVDSDTKNTRLPFSVFVEFNDLGLMVRREKVKDAFKRIEYINSKYDTLVVLFVHGWHHNANPKDSNVRSFNNLLLALQEQENNSEVGKKRKVIGVYVGWRGESNKLPIMNNITYADRKVAALRVGQYGAQEVLAELHKIRASTGKDNRLVIVGHSFGGGLIYSAVLQKILNDVVESSVEGFPKGSPALNPVDKAYGDLVVLVNPALEAAKVKVLNERIRIKSTNKFKTCQPVILASFTSKEDEALSTVVFRGGQKLFFRNQVKQAATSEGNNEDLVYTPYGLHKDFITHELSCATCGDYSEVAGSSILDEKIFQVSASSWNDFRAEGSPFIVPLNINDPKNGMVLTKFEPLIGDEENSVAAESPIINARVDNKIISGHNGIWGDNFITFIRVFIGMEFSKNEFARCSNN